MKHYVKVNVNISNIHEFTWRKGNFENTTKLTQISFKYTKLSQNLLIFVKLGKILLKWVFRR